MRISEAAVADIRNFVEGEYGHNYLPTKPNIFSSKKNAQDAHEAIRPTSIARTPEFLESYLSKDQLKLYGIIWKRALASQMAEAIYDVTTLLVEAGEYLLNASGSILKFDGFLRLSDKKELAEEKEKPVPFLEPATELKVAELQPAKQHFTEPPPYFTEATLVKELEDKGIGRPSTYSPTIQTILERNYIKKDGKKLVPTELGVLTLELLTNYFKSLIDIPFSAELESELDEVAENNLEKNEVLEKFYTPFSSALAVAEKEMPIVEMPVEVSDVQCDKCGRMMVYKQGRFGTFLACPGFPECRNTKPVLKKLGIKCPKCEQGEIIERKTKRGRIFYGCERYPDCDFTTWDKPLNDKCSKCNGLLLEKSGKNGLKKVYCSNEACENSKEK